MFRRLRNVLYEANKTTLLTLKNATAEKTIIFYFEQFSRAAIRIKR